jgi:putative CRISPR-associated protein (TIGR02619 family)
LSLRDGPRGRPRPAAFDGRRLISSERVPRPEATRTTVLFGTLGWRPQSLIPSIRSTEGLERVALYHSDHAKSREARAKLVEFCRGLGVHVNAVELDDAFNLIEIAERIRADVRKERAAGAAVRFNIAGGTRLMSSAALLACILEGVPATYVHDDTYEEIPLPLLRITYGERLTPKQREVLSFLVRNREKSFTETGLARALGVHKATMNHHVRELAARGAIERVRDPEDARALRIRAAPGMELLLG